AQRNASPGARVLTRLGGGRRTHIEVHGVAAAHAAGAFVHHVHAEHDVTIDFAELRERGQRLFQAHAVRWIDLNHAAARAQLHAAKRELTNEEAAPAVFGKRL